MAALAPAPAPTQQVHLEKKPVSYANLALGATLNLFEVSTLGQPFEVVKTQLAANRGQSMAQALSTIYSRGGIFGFYQGLIPWAWIEGATKGAVLLFTASEFEYRATVAGASPFTAGVVGGMAGGIAQAYSTMGFCTFMKTVEVTRHKSAVKESTFKIAGDIFKREGIVGINKGVNAVAVRQCTNWGSRFGITRFAQDSIAKAKYGDTTDATKRLTGIDKALASMVGGALSCWNQPIEVIRVEMQSQVSAPGRPEKMTIVKAAQWIHQNNGIKGFYRGAVPRIGLGMWQSACMIALGDYFRALFGTN